MTTTAEMVRYYGFYSNKLRGLRKKAGTDDQQLVKKILKHLSLLDVKHKPPARANGPPTETYF